MKLAVALGLLHCLACGGGVALAPSSTRQAAAPTATLVVPLPEDMTLPAGALAFAGAGASADGSVVALEIRGGERASVVVVRRGAGAATAEAVAGRLVPSTAPLLVRRDDAETIVIEDLANEQRYEVPWAGIAVGPSVPWFRDTVWAVTPPGTPPLLIRAFTTGDLSATRILAYRPGVASLAWEVALRVGATPGVVADAMVSDDGRVVMVQYTDGKQGARLVAYDIDTGAERWAQATGATNPYSSLGWSRQIGSRTGAVASGGSPRTRHREGNGRPARLGRREPTPRARPRSRASRDRTA